MWGFDLRGRLEDAVETLFVTGPDDRVFDAFILVAPLVVLVIALLGRTGVTTALAAGYLLAFVGYVVSLGVRHALGAGGSG